MGTELEIAKVVVTPFAQNCRILADRRTGTAVVVDPGGDSDKIRAELSRLNVQCKEIWLTHSHLDHCGGVASLQRATKARLLAHPDERAMRAGVRQICAMYGLPSDSLEDCPEPDQALHGGEELEFGAAKFQVLYTPGHSPGHVVFYEPTLGMVLAGDTLFAGSIGRTDLPGGDYDTLMASLQKVLMKLPGKTKVLPGHGEDTTIEAERQTNPFLQEMNNV